MHLISKPLPAIRGLILKVILNGELVITAIMSRNSIDLYTLTSEWSSVQKLGGRCDVLNAKRLNRSRLVSSRRCNLNNYWHTILNWKYVIVWTGHLVDTLGRLVKRMKWEQRGSRIIVKCGKIHFEIRHMF